MRRWSRKAPEDHLAPFEKVVLAMGAISGGNWHVFFVRVAIIVGIMCAMLFARGRGEPYRNYLTEGTDTRREVQEGGESE